MSMGVYRCLRESIDEYYYVSVYECHGSSCVSMGVYTDLWNNMNMWVTMGIIEFHGC